MKASLVRGWGRAEATPAEKVALARDYVRKNAVYFSKILYGLTFVPIPGIGTLATTKDLVCGYDPAYVSATEPEVLAADIAHEIMHVLEHHFDRLAWCKDKVRANIAADLPINQALRRVLSKGAPVWRLHPTAVMPEHFDVPEGRTAEQYYELLEKQAKAEKKKAKAAQGEGQQSAGGGQNPGQGQGASPSQGQGQPGAGSPGEAAGQGTPGQGGAGDGTGQSSGAGKGVTSGRCGSVAGGDDHPALAGVTGRSDVEKKAMVMQVAKAVKDHVAQHGRGSVPDSLLEWVEAKNRASKFDWKAQLANILRNCSGRIQSGGDDYSISRPSKRSFLRGFIRPGLIENLPVVAIVLDTSGSMGLEQLVAVLVEAAAILEALGIDEFWFAQADAAMAMDFRLVTAAFLKNLKVVGRGGTDFRPAFAALQKLNPRPDLVIYGTDGDGYAPRRPPPGIETVWCIVPSYYNRTPAPWGHAILATTDPSLKLRPPHIPPEEEEVA